MFLDGADEGFKRRDMYAIGRSFPTSLWLRMSPIAYLEVSVFTKNGCVKSGYCRSGSEHNEFLSNKNVSSCAFVHSNLMSFLSKFSKGWIVLEKSGITVKTVITGEIQELFYSFRIMGPRKVLDCFYFFESGLTLSFLITWLKYVTSLRKNSHLSGCRRKFAFRNLSVNLLNLISFTQ